MSYGIPLGQAASILAAIYAEGAVYQGTKPHPGRWRCNYESLWEKIMYQGTQHCTQETRRVPGSRKAVVGNWGS